MFLLRNYLFNRDQFRKGFDPMQGGVQNAFYVESDKIVKWYDMFKIIFLAAKSIKILKKTGRALRHSDCGKR